jgi:hypothetical protein
MTRLTSNEFEQGWVDSKTGRSYRMGPHWDWFKYELQLMDLYFYNMCINWKGLVILLIVMVIKEICNGM